MVSTSNCVSAIGRHVPVKASGAEIAGFPTSRNAGVRTPSCRLQIGRLP